MLKLSLLLGTFVIQMNVKNYKLKVVIRLILVVIIVVALQVKYSASLVYMKIAFRRMRAKLLIRMQTHIVRYVLFKD